jgi:hypothetical protein
MHVANLNAAKRWLSDIFGSVPPFGMRWRHARCAAWKPGDRGLIPEEGVKLIPPPALGSGKFGTPCERMHPLKAKSRLAGATVACKCLVAPQAATERLTAASAGATRTLGLRDFIASSCTCGRVTAR